MFYLTKKVDYGLNLLVSLAQTSKTPVTLTEIAAKSDLPRPFLAKLAASLVRAQILKSREGAAGGYILAKEPREITLRQVLAALEPIRENLTNCGNLCPCQFCTTRDVEKPLEEKITKTLQKKTLADFISKRNVEQLTTKDSVSL